MLHSFKFLLIVSSLMVIQKFGQFNCSHLSNEEVAKIIGKYGWDNSDDTEKQALVDRQIEILKQSIPATVPEIIDTLVEEGVENKHDILTVISKSIYDQLCESVDYMDQEYLNQFKPVIEGKISHKHFIVYASLLY